MKPARSGKYATVNPFRCNERIIYDMMKRAGNSPQTLDYTSLPRQIRNRIYDGESI